MILEKSIVLFEDFDQAAIYRKLERHARTCYHSESYITRDSYRGMLNLLMSKQHESVLEHVSLSARIVCDRGIMAELTRHRLASFSVESQRYCNYTKDKFNNQLSFIIPKHLEHLLYEGIFNDINIFRHLKNTQEYKWMEHLFLVEQKYISFIEAGWSPQEARSILPNATKTIVDLTANIREWRHILKLRTSKAAHPDMSDLLLPALHFLKSDAGLPMLFHDINKKEPDGNGIC